MKKRALQIGDKRLHAILSDGTLVFAEDIFALEDYSGLIIYRGWQGIGEDLPPTHLMSIWRRDNCAYCVEPIERQAIELDHIIPKSRGGSKGPFNLAPSCRACNQKKSAQLGWTTFDGRTGCFWDGTEWEGKPNPRPKRARDKEPTKFISLSRKAVELILPHALNKDFSYAPSD